MESARERRRARQSANGSVLFASPPGRTMAASSFVMGTARGWLAERFGSDVDEIRWIAADGGESHPIVNLPGGYQVPTFNSDGTRVYYMDAAPPGPTPKPPARLLRSVRLDGTDKKTHMKFQGHLYSIPSPDDE